MNVGEKKCITYCEVFRYYSNRGLNNINNIYEAHNLSISVFEGILEIQTSGCSLSWSHFCILGISIEKQNKKKTEQYTYSAE